MTGLIVRIDLGPHGRLGPGKLLLLENIDKHGSISAAGRAMNMSYRQAWSLIDQLNHAFKEPVVTSQTGGKSGGGASLTEFGKLLLAHCSAIIANAKITQLQHDVTRQHFIPNTLHFLKGIIPAIVFQNGIRQFEHKW